MAHTMEQARFDIAAAHRLGVKFNINEGFNGGHFTLMAPGYTNRILTIPNGLHWEEVLPEKVILIDLEANTCNPVEVAITINLLFYSNCLQNFKN